MARPNGTGTTQRLRITLIDSRPPIRRMIEVASDTDLAALHAILQAAMGWEEAHLYEFRSGDDAYGEAGDEALDWMPELKPAEETRLAGLLRKPGDRLTYVYDFGNSWEHEVRLEKVAEGEPGVTYPRCLAAERACPPEDCGGIPGYEMLLEALADPEHPDHEEMREWLGGGFDPEEVDLDQINREVADASRP